LGGWPILGSADGGSWVEADFNLTTLLTVLRKYNNQPLMSLYVSSDLKSTEDHIIYVSPGHGDVH